MHSGLGVYDVATAGTMNQAVIGLLILGFGWYLFFQLDAAFIRSQHRAVGGGAASAAPRRRSHSHSTSDSDSDGRRRRLTAAVVLVSALTLTVNVLAPALVYAAQHTVYFALCNVWNLCVLWTTFALALVVYQKLVKNVDEFEALLLRRTSHSLASDNAKAAARKPSATPSALHMHVQVQVQPTAAAAAAAAAADVRSPLPAPTSALPSTHERWSSPSAVHSPATAPAPQPPLPSPTPLTLPSAPAPVPAPAPAPAPAPELVPAAAAAAAADLIAVRKRLRSVWVFLAFGAALLGIGSAAMIYYLWIDTTQTRAPDGPVQGVDPLRVLCAVALYASWTLVLWSCWMAPESELTLPRASAVIRPMFAGAKPEIELESAPPEQPPPPPPPLPPQLRDYFLPGDVPRMPPASLPLSTLTVANAAPASFFDATCTLRPPPDPQHPLRQRELELLALTAAAPHAPADGAANGCGCSPMPAS